MKPRPVGTKQDEQTFRNKKRHPSFECTALVLQGGGALGAYQAGVYEALAEARIHPDWIAGISIGAVNSAIIAGNPPEKRVEKLRQFWELVTTDSCCGLRYGSSAVSGLPWAFRVPITIDGDAIRDIANQMSAGWAMLRGVPGFFCPRVPPPWSYPRGAAAATSFYDTTMLTSTWNV